MSEYRPGRCNIGSDQRRRRAGIAAVAFAVAAALVAGVAAGVLAGPLVLAAFVPLAVGFEWAFQSSQAFCVRLALAGEFAFGDDTGSVDDPAARRADQLYAAHITAASVLLAGAVTAAVAFLL
ncbi:MAG: hypothetical protein ABEH83_04630 [Halobacterium sp.]